MRIIQFYMKSDPHKTPRVGLFQEGKNRIIDFKTVDETAPNTLIEILNKRPDLLKTDPKTAFSSFEQDIIKAQDVRFLSPITGCDKVVCVGMNYVDHCEEQNVPVPDEPIFFNKFPSSLTGPFHHVEYPDITEELDWEVELAVIIKEKAKNITKEEAPRYILGYSVAHDLSARDWQLKRNGGQWLIGKSMDKFCPLGPSIVTSSEIKDPHTLAIKCRVNGKVKQDSNTSNLVFKVPDLVARLSQFVTLLPGDVILTGTPPGVGVFAKPPCFIQRGDVVECEIEGIGTIRNRFVDSRGEVGEFFCDF